MDYDNDRHFFLSQYFRNKYDESLKNYPYVNSRVQITRVEAWITNRQNRVSTTNNNLRNIIALQDLGEAPITGLNDNEIVDGEGIIGKKPVLKPGELHTYSSGCLLASPYGAMKGYFNMINFTTTKTFKVFVPTFRLSAPFALN